MPAPKTFDDQQPTDPRYRSAIERAKARTRTPAPPLVDTPRFDQIPKQPQSVRPEGQPAQKSRISEATAAGLNAMNEAQQRAAAAAASTPKPKSTQTEEEQAEAEETDAENTPAELNRYDAMKRAVEARVSPIDLYQYLSTGNAIQEVQIIKGQLVARYKTGTEYEEGWVDKQLALASKNPMSQRQVQRLLNELGLAVSLVAINGSTTGFPPATQPDGSVDAEAMAVRLESVRKLSSPLFTLFVLNLGWFTERVNETLSLETLKNG